MTWTYLLLLKHSTFFSSPISRTKTTPTSTEVSLHLFNELIDRSESATCLPTAGPSIAVVFIKWLNKIDPRQVHIHF